MTSPALHDGVVEFVNHIEENGFAIIPDAIDEATIASLITDLERVESNNAIRSKCGQPFGIRDLLNAVPSTRTLAESAAIRSIAQQVVGKSARVVRGLLFDKTSVANWHVNWHQDLTIAVKEKLQIPGFGCWTLKANLIHVQPPAWILEQMIALRIHLDDSSESTGALRVIPGSHRHGRLAPGKIEALKSSGATAVCPAQRGSVLAMRPLLLHSSTSGIKPKHRRVLHFEYSGVDLPQGLEWNC